MNRTIRNLALAAAFLGTTAVNSTAQPTVAWGYCGANGNNLTWLLTADSVLSIFGSGNMANYSMSTIPWYSYYSQIRTVTIGNSVKSIGNYAFRGCGSLTSVTIGDSITSIGDFAFCDCSSLDSVTIGNSVKNIGGYAFFDCSSLTSVTIPNSVTTIGGCAFMGCSSLISVTIPDSVTTIEISTFADCSSLTSVTIGCNMLRIKNGAFVYCTNLVSLTIYSPFPPFIENDAFFRVPNTLTVYVLCGFTSLYKSIQGWGDFNYAEVPPITPIQGICGANGDNLTWHLSLCDGILTISGSGAMADYIGYPENTPWKNYPWQIKTIIIGDSVTSIGNSAFYCQVDSVYIGKNVKSIGNASFSSCHKLATIVIPNNVTTIGDGAFNSCGGLISVTIGDGVILIGRLAFYNCPSLASVTIGANVSNIGQRAFHCTSLPSIALPNKVISLGNGAFELCPKLVFVSMGSSLNIIGPGAFSDCSSIDTLIVHPEIPPIVVFGGNNVFNNVPTTASVYVKCESTPKYKADTGWSYFSNFYAIDPPPTPMLSVEQQNNTMQITWTSTGAPDYEIYRNNVRLTKTSTTSYTDNNLKSSTTYCYQIKAIEENCESLLSDTICQTFSDVGIKQLRITNYELRVYPNPVNYELKITNYELKENTVIEIYNVVGQKVGAYPCGRPETTINVQHLANGMYYIKVNERVSKFVKMSD